MHPMGCILAIDILFRPVVGLRESARGGMHPALLYEARGRAFTMKSGCIPPRTLSGSPGTGLNRIHESENAPHWAHNSQISRSVPEIVPVFPLNVLSAVTQTALRDFSPARREDYSKKPPRPNAAFDDNVALTRREIGLAR